MNSQNHGFTLIELMIAVAIVGVLVAISIPLYQDFVIRARVTEVLLEASQVKTDVSGFVVSNGRFPASPSERAQFEITPAAWRGSLQSAGRLQGDEAGSEGSELSAWPRNREHKPAATGRQSPADREHNLGLRPTRRPGD